jgi:hypothetical protein
VPKRLQISELITAIQMSDNTNKRPNEKALTTLRIRQTIKLDFVFGKVPLWLRQRTAVRRILHGINFWSPFIVDIKLLFPRPYFIPG